MNLDRFILLCGMPGAGKSTTGRKLAELIGAPFSDSDQWIQEKNGKSIHELFLEGETYFRKVEQDAVYELIQLAPHILALGGGSLQNDEMIQTLKSVGILIFIDVPLSVLYQRLSNDGERPLLSGDQKERFQRLEELYQKRLPMYQKADLTIHIQDVNSPTEVATIIRDHIADRFKEEHLHNSNPSEGKRSL